MWEEGELKSLVVAPCLVYVALFSSASEYVAMRSDGSVAV